MIKSCITAIRTLTILPIPGKDTERFASSLPFFPIAGGILAATLYFQQIIVNFLPDVSFLSGIVMVTVLLWLTGAIHLDGLADIADGFGGGRNNKEKILQIFKDSRLGTFGVTALVTDLLAKIVIYTWCYQNKKLWIIAMSIIWSRMFQAIALSFLPSATPDKGIAASFSGGKYKVQVIIVSVFLVILTYFFCKNKFIMLCLPCTLIVLSFFASACIKKIGGITGDCIGAINEISEVTLLLSVILIEYHMQI